MDIKKSEELSALTARLDDLLARAGGGELAVSAFLSPREQAAAKRHLTRCSASFRLWGGFASAERQRVYFLPDYIELEDGEELERALSEFGYSTAISALRIEGSGYRTLTHRDFLGSLLGLGLERTVVGDILLLGDEGKEALVFCDSGIAEFIKEELRAVANDKVKVKEAEGSIKPPPRKTQPIHDTVASARIDAVVAALCSLSREKARAAVVSGLVEIDYESEERPDRTVSEASVISVRGFGKYRVMALSDKTRKGRYRLEAEKYV